MLTTTTVRMEIATYPGAGRILRMMGVNIIQGENKIHFDNIMMLEVGTYQISVKNINSNILYSSIVTKF